MDTLSIQQDNIPHVRSSDVRLTNSGVQHCSTQRRIVRVSKRHPSFSHHLDEIAQAEFAEQIPAHAKNDHVAVKVTAREQFLAKCSPTVAMFMMNPFLPWTSRLLHIDMSPSPVARLVRHITALVWLRFERAKYFSKPRVWMLPGAIAFMQMATAAVTVRNRVARCLEASFHIADQFDLYSALEYRIPLRDNFSCLWSLK